MDIKKILSLKILFLVFCLGLASNVFAIGMITEPIVIENILRGGKISETITVFNPENGEAIYQLGTSGQINGWVEFFEIGKPDIAVSKVNVPAKKYYDLTAVITIPDSTPNGEYIGEIFVKQEAKEKPKEGESAVSISQMVSKAVKIKVTDQEVVKIETTLIPEAYDVKQEESLKIKVIYENLGNIALRPDLKLKISNTNDEKTVFNAIFPYPETEEAVKPGEKKTMPDFEWQTTGQPKGKYLAEITTLINNEVFGTKDFRFNIGDVSSDNKKNWGFLAGSFIGKSNLTLIWVIIGGILLVFAKVLIAFHKKNKKIKILPTKTKK